MIEADSISGDLAAIAKPSEGLFSSFNEYQADFFKTANTISELNDSTDTSLNIEEQTLNIQQDELNTLNGILASAQTQIDSINGLSVSIMSVMDALASFQSAAVSAGGGSGGGGSAGAPISAADSNAMLVSALYETGLGRQADVGGQAFWQSQLDSGRSIDEVKSSFFAAATVNNEPIVQAFANGGNHSGGLRMVGERGPELEVTGPSRIIKNSDILGSLSGNKSDNGMSERMGFTLTKMNDVLTRMYRQQQEWTNDALNVRVVTA